MTGWVEVNSELTYKAIWQTSTPEEKTILITLMVMAKNKSKQCEYVELITTLESIVSKAGKGITKENVRSALKKFAKLEFLTSVSTNKGLYIKISNSNFHQYN